MRRWNGWGDDKVHYLVDDLAQAYLASELGTGATVHDVDFKSVAASIPKSSLPDYSWLEQDPAVRIRHSRGQSLPDWIALRSGRINLFTDGVAFPSSPEEIREILSRAAEDGFVVVPYGGGTSVVGHINPVSTGKPSLTLSMVKANRLNDLDRESLLARFEAGATGPTLEAELRKHGCVLGHYPQSFEYSTLGGWIASRSSGQQSYYYGRIEDLFAGGHIETPSGPLEIQPLPASSAGPDLRQLILGSEGRLGVIFDAAVRIRPIPESESFRGAFFHDWQSGVDCVRTLVQNNHRLSMLRLSDPLETVITLKLAGRPELLKWAGRGLRALGYGGESCLLLFGVTGSKKEASRIRRSTSSMIRIFRGLNAGTIVGKSWQRSRFKAPYLRNTLWELGYAIDTLETAVPWAKVLRVKEKIIAGIQEAAKTKDFPVLVFAHLSHVYTDGASIYVTLVFPRSSDPDENLERWASMKNAASQTIVRHHGTISHQHGVGLDHLAYMRAEKDKLGLQLLQDLQRQTDPMGVMNPGKLLPDLSEGLGSRVDRVV